MKVLYLITALGVGGAENLLVDVCATLKNRHDITVGFFVDLRHFEPALNELGIETVFFPFKPSGIFSTILKLRKFIKKNKFEIVHTHLPLADSLGRIAALLVRKVKVISTIHNSDPWKLEKSIPSLSIRTFNFLTVNFFPRVRLITVSKSSKDFCIKHEWIREKKIKVIYNFIDFENEIKETDDFMPLFDRNKHFVLVTVARLEENKGHRFLFDAMSELSADERFSHVRLMVMGGGSKEQEFRELVKEKGLSEQIVFTGRQKNVYDYLRSSDLFILASQNEGQSIAMLESFYCHTPVLASEIEANVELLAEGKNGVLFEYGNSADLVQKIKSFALHKYDTATFTRNAYEFCQTFSRHKYAIIVDSFMRSKKAN